MSALQNLTVASQQIAVTHTGALLELARHVKDEPARPCIALLLQGRRVQGQAVRWQSPLIREVA